MKRAVVIADYTGKVHAVYPVADTFTYDDLNQVKEQAEYYNQTADLLDIEDESSCVGEVVSKVAELNGDEPEQDDSRHIVHYTFDEVYDSEGEEWNNDED